MDFFFRKLFLRWSVFFSFFQSKLAIFSFFVFVYVSSFFCGNPVISSKKFFSLASCDFLKKVGRGVPLASKCLVNALLWRNNYLRNNGFTVHRNPVAQSTDGIRGLRIVVFSILVTSLFIYFIIFFLVTDFYFFAFCLLKNFVFVRFWLLALKIEVLQARKALTAVYMHGNLFGRAR